MNAPLTLPNLPAAAGDSVGLKAGQLLVKNV